MGLERASLRRLLDAGPGRVNLVDGDEARPHRDSLIPAAVLIGIVDRNGGPTVLLTQRTDHLKDHAGQISFPGGRIEPADDTPMAAALREADEEIGLPPAAVDVIGTLACYRTVTGFRIHPIVGWVTPPVAFRRDPIEVAEIFEVPLAFVLEPANYQWQSREHGGRLRHFYALAYQGRHIWGATAAMLVNLSRILQDDG